MGRISLFGLGQASRSPYVTAKQLTNIYCEQRPQGEKSVLVGYGTPGLNLFATLVGTPIQGAIEFEKTSVAYVVAGGVFYQVTSTGVVTVIGFISVSAGKVSMAHNGIQVMLVDGVAGYIYNTATLVFSAIVFPSNPQTCCFLAQRFVASFANSGRLYWSEVDDGTSWPALNFANAEYNPDANVAVYASNGQIVVFGFETCEFWSKSGLADPAFTPLQGTSNEWGLAAVNSIAKYDNSFICLMKNRMGQVMVAQMNGYVPKKISTVDMDHIINDYATVSDASAYSYMLGGHPMYVINFPTDGASWLFDGSTGIWTSLKSFGITRHRAEFSFNLVGEIILADFENGNLYELSDDTFTDNGAMIEREIIGETIAQQGEEFMDINCLRVDMETGVGLAVGQGSNPQVSLSVSRDNGKTYGPEMWKPMGATGDYSTRVEWRRLGSQRYLTPKIRITDPVKVTFVSACINPEN